MTIFYDTIVVYIRGKLYVMKHLDELTLLNLATKRLCQDEEKKATLHVEECSICYKKLQLIQTTIAPQKCPEPSRDILSFLLEYHSQTQLKQESFFTKIRMFIQTHTRSLAFSLGIIIAGIAISLFSTTFSYKPIPHILYIADNSGNNFWTQTIKEGHRVRIKENSTAMLLANNDIRIQLIAGADLTITKSYFNKSIAKKTFQYHINNGSVNVKSFGSHQSMQYQIKTPDAIIQPSGTEFYINVSPEGTHIYIIEGKVVLNNLSTNETTETDIGKLYTITKSEIVSFDIEKYALQWVNDIDTVFNDLSQNTDFGSFSIIKDNINDNTGKEIITKIKPDNITSPEPTVQKTDLLKNKGDIQEIKDLHNEMRQLKKESKQMHGK